MTTFLYLCIVGEMIFINLATTHICMTKKYSTFKIIQATLAFSVVVVGGMLVILSRLPYYGNGNGLFVFAGFLYLIPLKYLYKERIIYVLEVLCSSWIYTLLAFMLSVHTAKLFPEEQFVILVFCIQTAFYLITVKSFWKFIRDKFIYILQNIPERTRNYLRYGSIFWFVAMIAINLSFVAENSGAAKIVALAFMGGIAVVSYSLIYEITKTNHSAQQMKQIATTDYLTKLPNR